MRASPGSDAHALNALIEALKRLPGVGPKSATRMAFHLLQHDRAGASQLAQALEMAVQEVRHCQQCHTFSQHEICPTCSDPQRQSHLLCVVENPADQSAIERTRTFTGRYFVLMGRLSPQDGIGPQDIGLQQLLQRACHRTGLKAPWPSGHALGTWRASGQ